MFLQAVGVVFIALQLSVFQGLFIDILHISIALQEELSCKKILNIKINNIINDVSAVVFYYAYESTAPEMSYRMSYSMSRSRILVKKRQAYHSGDILHLSITAMSEPGASTVSG